MCGLVGIFGDINLKGHKIFYDLLHLDEIRGPHSTGVAIVPRKQKSITVIKEVGGAGNLLNSNKFKAITNNQHTLLMGHNRWATVGAIKVENAHPFTYKHITMVHNGTLTNENQLPYNIECETDSERIARSIADFGIKNTWKNLVGAAVLVWWDQKEKSLNIISNSQRPFYYCELAETNTLVWASESWMIRGAVSRNVSKIKDDQLWYPAKDMLLSFKYGRKGGVIEKVFTKLEPFTYPKSNYVYKQPSYLFKPKEQNKKMVPPKPYTKLIGNWENHQYAEDWENMLALDCLTFKDFKVYYEQCVFCHQPLTNLEAYQDAIILDDQSAVCGGCVSMADSNNLILNKDCLL